MSGSAGKSKSVGTLSPGVKLSAEFEDFAGQFFAGILDEVHAEDELIEMALQPFKSCAFRSKLRAYLDEITDDSVAGEDLRKLWWSSPADTVFHDGEELRTFLRHVRDRL